MTTEPSYTTERIVTDLHYHERTLRTDLKGPSYAEVLTAAVAVAEKQLGDGKADETVEITVHNVGGCGAWRGTVRQRAIVGEKE